MSIPERSSKQMSNNLSSIKSPLKFAKEVKTLGQAKSPFKIEGSSYSSISKKMISSALSPKYKLEDIKEQLSNNEEFIKYHSELKNELSQYDDGKKSLLKMINNTLEKLSSVNSLIENQEENYLETLSGICSEVYENLEKCGKQVEEMPKSKGENLKKIEELFIKAKENFLNCVCTESEAKDKLIEENNVLQNKLADYIEKTNKNEEKYKNRIDFLSSSLDKKNEEQINKENLIKQYEIDLQNANKIIEKLKEDNFKALEDKNNEIQQIQSQIGITQSASNLNEEVKNLIHSKNEEIRRLSELLNMTSERFEQTNKIVETKVANYEGRINDLKPIINEIITANTTQIRKEEAYKNELINERNNSQIQKEEYERVLYEKEDQRMKQKAEWTEIYSNMKMEIEDLKSDVNLLNTENDKLMKQLESVEQKHTVDSFKELETKLKAGDEENIELWKVISQIDKANPSLKIHDLFIQLNHPSIEEKANEILS